MVRMERRTLLGVKNGACEGTCWSSSLLLFYIFLKDDFVCLLAGEDCLQVSAMTVIMQREVS